MQDKVDEFWSAFRQNFESKEQYDPNILKWLEQLQWYGSDEIEKPREIEDDKEVSEEPSISILSDASHPLQELELIYGDGDQAMKTEQAY